MSNTQTVRNSRQAIKGNKNTQQIINIIVDSLRKKKKRSKPTPQEDVQQPPMTLEDIASTMKPSAYAPTNVVTVNPYGLPQPTMFDLFKQQKLNSYMNRMEELKNNIADARVNAEPMIQSLVNSGRTQEAQSISDQLDQLEQQASDPSVSAESVNGNEEVVDVPFQSQSPMTMYSNPVYFVDQTPQVTAQATPQSPSTIELYQQYMQDMNGIIDGKYGAEVLHNYMSPQQMQELMQSPYISDSDREFMLEALQSPAPSGRRNAPLETPSNSVVKSISFSPSPYALPTPNNDEAGPSTPAPTHRISEISVPELESTKSEIAASVKKHGQKRAILQDWKDKVDSIHDEDYRNMSKNEMTRFRNQIRRTAIDFVNEMIMPGENRDEMLSVIADVFKPRKKTKTQLQYLRYLVDLNP